MTRSSRCPIRDDRGAPVVAAGAGGKPQGLAARLATGPEPTTPRRLRRSHRRAPWRGGPQRRSGIVRMPATPDSAARPANAVGDDEPQERRPAGPGRGPRGLAQRAPRWNSAGTRESAGPATPADPWCTATKRVAGRSRVGTLKRTQSQRTPPSPARGGDGRRRQPDAGKSADRNIGRAGQADTAEETPGPGGHPNCGGETRKSARSHGPAMARRHRTSNANL